MRRKNIFIALFILAYICTLAFLIIKTWLPIYVMPAVLVISTLTYATYAKDKKASVQKEWRVPENNLHFLAVIGGWPGALIAQQRLRHKSSKTAFKIVFYITIFLNITAIAGFVLQQDAQVQNKLQQTIRAHINTVQSKF